MPGSRSSCARSTAWPAPVTATASAQPAAWPSGDWGSLPIEGGLEAAYRRELEAAADPAALRAEIAARLDAVRSPFRSAEHFSVEEIIDPRDTRPLLCDWAERAHELIRHDLAAGPKGRGPRPRSVPAGASPAVATTQAARRATGLDVCSMCREKAGWAFACHGRALFVAGGSGQRTGRARGGTKRRIGVWIGRALDVELMLATTEAVANAIEHGESGPIELRIGRTGDWLSVEVRSRGSFAYRPIAQERTSIRGRGLQIMAAVVDWLELHPSERATCVRLNKRLNAAA